jgi:hypothetical protein
MRVERGYSLVVEVFVIVHEPLLCFFLCLARGLSFVHNNKRRTLLQLLPAQAVSTERTNNAQVGKLGFFFLFPSLLLLLGVVKKNNWQNLSFSFGRSIGIHKSNNDALFVNRCGIRDRRDEFSVPIIFLATPTPTEER